MRIALLGLLGLSALVAAGQQPRALPGAPVSVSGYVLEATTGKPISGVEVTIYLQTAVSTTTNAEGSFHFDNIPPGTYSFGTYKGGYAAEVIRYGNRRITLEPGQPRTDMVLRLQRTGTLSGRILDPNGRPVVQVNVSVLRYAYREFHREPLGVARFAGRATDDRGEFRLFDVPAGEYFVIVEPRGLPFGAAFYPGEREVRRAERIEVRPEAETRLRDLALPPSMRGVIRLHVVNATGAPLPSGVTIGAVASGSSVSSAFIPVDELPGSKAELRQFQPALVGSYVFHSAFQTAAGNIAGYTKVDYSGADVDADFVLAKLSGQIKGRVLLQSPNGSTQPVSGAEMEFFGMSAESNFSTADGTFNVRGLLNGPYQFSGAFEMPKGYYVASVRDRDRDRDVLKDGITVSEGTPELEVRVRADGGSLEGKIADSRGRAAHDAVIALVPQSLLQDRTDRQNTYRIERSAAGGVFDLHGIVPGEYEIYAWSDAPQDAVMDPAVTQVQTDPSPDNVRAIRSYQRAGFVIEAEIITPDGPALLMLRHRDQR